MTRVYDSFFTNLISIVLLSFIVLITVTVHKATRRPKKYLALSNLKCLSNEILCSVLLIAFERSLKTTIYVLWYMNSFKTLQDMAFMLNKQNAKEQINRY